MDKVVSPERRRFLAATAASMLPLRGALAQGSPAAAVRAGNIAVIGEPGSIDPMLTLADLVNQIDQHFFETLYYMDPLFHIGPVLAAAMPDISSDGLRYTIPLRENVPFHDGTIMVADDVVATLPRCTVGSRCRRARRRRHRSSMPSPHRTRRPWSSR
jgi:peptide/nickel transport system substrate-binding protein